MPFLGTVGRAPRNLGATMTLDNMTAGGAVGLCDDLMDAVIGLDDERMRDLMMAVGERDGHDVLVTTLLVPTLRTVGQLWAEGKLSVMHEHHASSIIRSVIGEVRRRDAPADAPRVVLSCPPGELHDLPAHMFSLMLINRGLKTVVLGANTPLNALGQAVRATQAASCVLVARKERSILAYQSPLRRLSHSTALFVAGPAASRATADQTGLQILSHDWVQAADVVRDAALTGSGSSDQGV